jgi:predicted amidohydrolase YtcJ
MFASDTLLIHGHIYTGNAKAPWAQALAITGTRIESVGTDQEILSRRQAKTEVIDLHTNRDSRHFGFPHSHVVRGHGAARLQSLDT